MNLGNRVRPMALVQTLQAQLKRLLTDSGALWLGVATILASGLNYVTQSLPAWYLSREDYAAFALVMSMLLLAASTVGTAASYSVAISEAKGQESPDSALIAVLLGGALLVGALLLSVFAYRFSQYATTVIGLTIFFLVLLLTVKGVFLGHDKVRRFAGFHLLDPLLRVMFVTGMVVIFHSMEAAVTGILIAIVLTFGLIVAQNQEWLRTQEIAFRVQTLRRVGTSFVLVATFLFVLSFGLLYLGWLDRQSTAYLSALLFVARGPWYALASIGIADMAKLASAPSWDAYKEIYSSGLKLVSWLGLAAYLAVAAGGGWVVSLIFPAAYAEALTFPMYVCVALSHFLLTIAFYRALALLALERSRRLWIMALVSTAGMLVLTILLQPWMIWGVIVAMLAVSIAVVLLTMAGEVEVHS
jgi:O-antigen/teichoic acid export membrane protein